MQELHYCAGAAELSESAFSSEGLAVSLGRATDGQAKATVTPEGSPPTFFLCVRVKERAVLVVPT